MAFDKTWRFIIFVNRKPWDAYTDQQQAMKVYSEIKADEKYFGECLIEIVQVLDANRPIDGESPKKQGWWKSLGEKELRTAIAETVGAFTRGLLDIGGK